LIFPHSEKMGNMRFKILVSVATLLPMSFARGETPFRVHGNAWFDFGRIMHAEDTLALKGRVVDYSGNPLQSIGAQFTVLADLSEHLEGGFGFGTYRATHALGSGQSQLLAISLFQNFLTQSRLTWYAGEKEAPRFSVSVGGFPYVYNPDVKNLGLYLLRGPVYPGILMGGFRDFSADSTKGNILGARIHHSTGLFSHDLILNNERDVPPTFDWSLAYLAGLDLGALHLGAGVNFYRLIPYNSKLEIPGKDTTLVRGTARLAYIEFEPGGGDTVYFTHQGTKLEFNASLDIKRLLGGIDALGEDDLKLYGEAALLGVKNYGKAYGKRSERIPMMVGFNFPTWRLLNHLSLEVEYYGAKYRNDLILAGNNNVVADWTAQEHPIPSPKPPSNSDYGIGPSGYYRLPSGDSVNVRGTAMDKENVTKDNLKWSLYVDKVVANHVQFLAQIANDHYRPRPIATGLIFSGGGTAEAFASPKDWYYMLRVGYLF
jgi:hypothetical protein